MNSDKGLPRFAFRSAAKAQNFVQKRASSMRNPPGSNSAYKTRKSDGSLMTFKKARYSPELPIRRKRRGGASNLNSSDTTEEEQRRNSDVSSDEGSVELTFEEPMPKRPCHLTTEQLAEEVKEEIRSEKSDEGSPKVTESEYERQFKRAIRLYRYMALPDGDALRPIYRPFLKRNLSYMKGTSFTPNETHSSDSATERRPQRDARIRRMQLRSVEQKRANIKSVVSTLHKRMGSQSSSSSNSPVKDDWKHTKRIPPSLVMRRSLNGASGVENSTSEREIGSKHANCSHSSSLLRFVDVRNNELPGSRHAMITVYLCTEIDGKFDEIVRVPSATVQMPVNNRSTPVNIDLPHGIGCPLDCVGTERNDYVIIRVTFSGEEDARVFGGRTLRGVPSRQAGKAEIKMTRRSVSNALTKKPVGTEDSVAVYGARCICSMGNPKHSPGIIYGDGSINLVPESLLGINDNWRRDGSLARKIIELGKKVHESPFVHMSIMQDCGGETSSSEDDDETKSLTSESSSLLTHKGDTERQTRSVSKSHISDEQPASIATEDDGYDDYMKARFRHEMSLQFPKQICYRFIMKYNDQPNTSFPENKLRSVPDEPPCVSALADSPSKQPMRIVANKLDKQPRSGVWPLKEVSSANFLNGHAIGIKQRRSARIGSPSKPVVPASKPLTGTPMRLRLDVPRRDSPLPEMIDAYAEQFDKCASVQPPNDDDDDKMAESEARNSDDQQEPEGNAVVTRLLSPPNKCFFCLGTFPDMFALLMHLRTCYPRLDIVYRGDVRSSVAANSSAPVYIDIFVREHFDGSFEGPMIRQYVGVRNRIVPQRCTPSDRLTYIVYKAEARYIRHMPKDLSIFFTQSDREKRALRGNNAAYFGFRSRHPLMSSSQVPAKQLDQEWMRRMIIRQIEDFVDLSRPEKEFMKLWNLFVLDPNTRPFGWCHMYRTCRLFLDKHRDELVAKDLRRAWVYHLAAFNEKDALDAEETYDLTQRLSADYDPTSDKCHIVCRTRTCDEQPSTSTKRKTPAWQRAPIPGPKASILRSASVTSRLSSVGGPSSDNEEVFKKFPDDSSRDERRCSSCSTDDVTRHNSVRRHRESDLSKYMMTTLRVTDPPSKWFSSEEDSTS